jgi:putative spermidine/putrescine transport system permease protein
MSTAVVAAPNSRERSQPFARQIRLPLLLLTAPALALAAVIIFGPLLWLFWESFRSGGEFTSANYTRIVTEPSYSVIIRRTFVLSAVVTLFTVLLGYPLAYWMTQVRQRTAYIAILLILLPFWTSLLVRSYAWLVILQRRGVVNNALINLGIISEPVQLVHNLFGTIVGMVHIALPFLVLPLYAAMRTIDKSLPKAAMSLGATPTRAFWSTVMPLTLPALGTGALLVYVYCLGFYVAPQILGGGRVNMLAMKALETVTVYTDWGAASALGAVLLFSTFGIMFGIGWVTQRVQKRFGRQNG